MKLNKFARFLIWLSLIIITGIFVSIAITKYVNRYAWAEEKCDYYSVPEYDNEVLKLYDDNGNLVIHHINCDDTMKEYKFVNGENVLIEDTTETTSKLESTASKEVSSTEVCSEQVTSKLSTSKHKSKKNKEVKPSKRNLPLDDNYIKYVEDKCVEYGVPAELVFAVMKVESNFDNSQVSATNDYGIMQINAINFGHLQETLGISDCTELYNNTLCGIYMLSDLYNKYGDYHKVCMAYNCGEGGANSLWEQGIYYTDYSRKVVENIE